MIQPLPLDARRITVESVIVDGRARRDLGDLAPLMESMQTLRLINPITVTPERELIAGGRRIEAAKRLGWRNIPCTVVDNAGDAAMLLKLERDENVCRKEMTASEMLDLARRLEALEKPKAAQRKVDSGRVAAEKRWSDGSAPSCADPSDRQHSAHSSHYKVSEVIGPAVGLSPRSYEKLRTVDRARESTDPHVAEVAKEAFVDLDTGEISVNAADLRVRAARREADQATHDTPTATPAPPTGKRAQARARKEPQPEPETPMPAPPKRPGKPGPSAFPPDATVIRRVVESIHGFNLALDRIASKDLDTSVTAEEAAALNSDLTREIRSLNRIATQLKNRKNP